MKKFEYKVLYDEPAYMSFHEYLNMLGAQGWELVQVYPKPYDAYTGIAIFKREKQND